MANYNKEELYNLIKTNPKEFTNWKTGKENIDLSELDFSYLTLNDIDFSNIDLNSSSFSDANLSLINFSKADLTSVDFTRASVLESNFTEAVLTGADYSYATIHYCNFTDADMAGGVFQESDLTNTDFAGAFNLNACRFDEETIWPDPEMLPEDFDSTYSDDLSSLKDEDEDEEFSTSDY